MTTLLQLSWSFFKMGLLCWGGGIVILPLMEQDVVWNYYWLTQKEFVDAVTLGQITPGPLIISATFIGYKVAGLLGAIVATVSVTFPSFIFICMATECVERFRGNRWVMGFFHGARAAVIGLIFDAALSIVSPMTFFIALAGFIAMAKYGLSPVWLILGGFLVGLIT